MCLKSIPLGAAPTLVLETDMNALQDRWYSASGASVPKRFEMVNDSCSADTAYRLACAGTALLWQGDFQQARQLLQALTRRVSRHIAGQTKQSRYASSLSCLPHGAGTTFANFVHVGIAS
jgi:hypothetical protein